jgi:hypothetical protein
MLHRSRANHRVFFLPETNATECWAKSKIESFLFLRYSITPLLRYSVTPFVFQICFEDMTRLNIVNTILNLYACMGGFKTQSVWFHERCSYFIGCENSRMLSYSMSILSSKLGRPYLYLGLISFFRIESCILGESCFKPLNSK